MKRINQAGAWVLVVGVVIICGGLLAVLAGQTPMGVALGATGLLGVVAGLLGVHQ